MKVVSFGSIFIILIVLSIIGIGIYSMTNTIYFFTSDEILSNYLTSDIRYLLTVNSNLGPLAGAYCCGFYLHQSAIPMLKKNKNQRNNLRDVGIGFILVCTSYLLIGFFGYIGFMGIYFLEA